MEHSMSSGYHYIRYGMLGIFLLSIHKVVDWLVDGVVPVTAISACGVFLTIGIIMIDIRNYFLWRRETKSPGFPVVSWFLYILYPLCLVWFLLLPNSSLKINSWYLSSAEQIKKPEEVLSYLTTLKPVELEKEEIELSEKQSMFAQERRELEAQKIELEKERVELDRERVRFEESERELRVTIAKLQRELDELNEAKLQLRLNRYAATAIIVFAVVLTIPVIIYDIRLILRFD